LDPEARAFWRQQRQAALRRRGRSPFGGFGLPITYALIGLTVLVFLVESFAPGVLFSLSLLPVWPILALLLSPVTPGGILGLLFLGFFLYVMGMQLEPRDVGWKYLLLFFASGAVSALIVERLTGSALVPSFAGFGLAGAYAYGLYRGGMGLQGAGGWVIGLLLLNAVLGGFQAVALAGMVGAFAAGAALAYALGYGGPPRRFV
jgi:membrane associated rhomboid family serine protease